MLESISDPGERKGEVTYEGNTRRVENIRITGVKTVFKKIKIVYFFGKREGRQESSGVDYSLYTRALKKKKSYL